MPAPGSTPIILYNSGTTTNIPTAGNVNLGELALNYTDKKIYTKDSGGTVYQIVGTLGNQDSDDVTITAGDITVDTFACVSVTITGGTIAGVALTTVTIDGDNALVDGDIDSTVQGYDANLDVWEAKTAPSGVVVGTTDTQTLSGKTYDDASFTGSIEEETYLLTGTALDPANGTIQTLTLTANKTLTDSMTDGESLTLHVYDGDTYTLTWPGIQWINNSTPTLTAADVVVLWKISTTLYASYVGPLP